eukprot:TRINITY_DN13934_c0_g1_i2.p1 TRINITY_DN13934_c0_g1~~TRINITY_DN13934_c0_g1_i2.p1  ORF type:complete len:124 (-),score=18.25 TRINITY_DN13934_c0_g1_i2:78-449(-)
MSMFIIINSIVEYCSLFFFFFKQKTAYEMLRSLVGSEMCIRDSYRRLNVSLSRRRSSQRLFSQVVQLHSIVVIGDPHPERDKLSQERLLCQLRICRHQLQNIVLPELLEFTCDQGLCCRQLML